MIARHLKLVGFIVLILFAYSAIGLSQHHVLFEHLDQSSGLPNNKIEVLYQDSRGVIWMGTEQGLVSFDGYRFITHSREEGYDIPDLLIFAIAEDKLGSMWIGTQTGLYVYDPITNTTKEIRHDPEDENSIPSNEILGLLVDSQGDVFVGTPNGFAIYRAKQEQFERFYFNVNPSAYLGNEGFYCFFEDEKGVIWIGGRNSKLWRYDKQKNQFQTYPLKNIDPRYKGVQLTRVRAMAGNGDSNIWLGTSDGLVKFNKDSEEFTYFYPDGTPGCIAGNDARGIAFDRSGRLWIGTRNGLSILEPGSSKFETFRHDARNPYSLSANTIHHLMIDRSGVVWMGTLQGGLNKTLSYDRGFKNYTHIPGVSLVEQTNIYSVYQDNKGVIWSGSLNGIVEKIDPSKNSIERFQVFPKDLVVSQDVCVAKIVEDFSGNLWVGSWSLWLLKWDKMTNEITPIRRWEEKKDGLGVYSIRDMLVDENERLWIASVDNGLNMVELSRYKGEGNHDYYFHKYTATLGSLTSNALLCLAKRENEIWVGSVRHGIDILDIESGNFRNVSFTSNDYPPWFTYRVKQILFSSKEPDSIAWVATSSGLFRYNFLENSHIRYTTRDGLSSNYVVGILEDVNGEIWLSTMNGLTRFDPVNKIWKQFNKDNGILNLEFNQRASYKNPTTGNMLFGGTNGFTFFHPSEIQQDSIPPRVMITNLKLFGKVVKVGEVVNKDTVLSKAIHSLESIRLNHANNDLSFEFSSLHFVNPHANKYKYRMSGVDGEWKYTELGRNEAVYTNLNPGKYLFEVYGSNNDGVWSVEPATFNIHILPPFYRTWLFRFIVLMLTLGMVGLYFTIRIHSIKLQRNYLEEQVKIRTQELEEINTQLEESREEVTLQYEELVKQSDSLNLLNARIRKDKRIIEVQNEELTSHRAQLEELVVQRTGELVKALDKAEESGRLKSLFLANLSHEIRTPMNAILGFSNLLSERTYNTKERDNFIDLIRRNGESLLHIIDDMLDLSLLQASQMNLNVSPIDLQELFLQLHESFLTRAQRKDLELAIRIEKDPGPVTSDSTRLRQVFSNLIDNAIKFTDTGMVSFGVHDIVNSEVVFFVRDTGVGIPVDASSQVFESFLKVEVDNNRFFNGVGLGLAITKGLIDLMRGSIWLESIPGRGTVFFFSLPVDS